MGEEEAIETVKQIKPKLVILMHYNCPMLFTKNGNPADDKKFKKEVENLGCECSILGKEDFIILWFIA